MEVVDVEWDVRGICVGGVGCKAMAAECVQESAIY